MTDNDYNHVLVMIDHFTKYAEAVPCITASEEETCDHLINTWVARHGFPMTFQSDNGTAWNRKKYNPYGDDFGTERNITLTVTTL